jgi:hypothetical protein
MNLPNRKGKVNKMKTIATIILALTMTMNINVSYSKVMRIVEVNYEENLVLCVDMNGEEWAFEGTEDYFINDAVVCEMYDNNTINIYDDEIINVYYAGFTF